MKKVISGILVLALAIFLIAYVSCKSTPPRTQTFETASTSYSDSEVAPSSINVYIDASGSMKGYFSLQSDQRFIAAISNVNPAKMMWMDGKCTEIKGIPTNQFLTNNFSGGDSRFDKMLSEIITRDKLNKNDTTISLLFTDGIISASVAQTRVNPEFMKQTFIMFKNYIANEIKKTPGIAIAMFKLDGKYNGTYWNYQNKSVPSVDILDRPFYVIAMGKPAQIRSFVKNNKLGASLQASFGVYDKQENNVPGTTFVEKNPNQWSDGTKILKLTGSDVDFYLTLPKYVADLGADYVKKNLVIEFDGADVTEKLASLVSINSKNLTFGTWNVNDVSKPIIIPGEHQLDIKVKKTLPDGWNLLYSEDDKGVKNVISEQKKTFALEYLIKGIQEGLEPDDMVLFSSSIKFER